MSATGISAVGLNLIKEFEGFPYGGRPYWDAYGKVWTRGYGETDGITRYSPPETEAQAFAELKRRLHNNYEYAVRAVSQAVGGLTQNQWDALDSVVWNLGPGIIAAGTSLGSLLRARNWTGFAAHLQQYDHAANGQVLAGLQRRRAAEAKMFLDGDASAGNGVLAGYRDDEVRWIREYDQLVKAHSTSHRIAVLRRVMKQRRQQIFHVAQSTPNGWDIAHRRQRYHSLFARSN